MTLPTAFSVSMLAFGLLTFSGGYSSEPGLQQATQNEIIWGADYLLKLISPQGTGYSLIYQVDSLTPSLLPLYKFYKFYRLNSQSCPYGFFQRGAVELMPPTYAGTQGFFSF